LVKVPQFGLNIMVKWLTNIFKKKEDPVVQSLVDNLSQDMVKNPYDWTMTQTTSYVKTTMLVDMSYVNKKEMITIDHHLSSDPRLGLQESMIINADLEVVLSENMEKIRDAFDSVEARLKRKKNDEFLKKWSNVEFAK
jgi:divalent metal cation (Fe/Co/Zn/Cd) transporter